MAVDMGSAVAYLLLDTTNFNTALNGAQNGLVSAGAKMASAGATMTATVTRGLIKVGQSAVETTAKFESAMSQVQATKGITVDALDTLNGATVNTMDALGDLAKQLGGSTKFTATEAAEAINNMAMAGYNVQETYDALPTVLSLASAGALDLSYATQLVANGLNVMNMETKDAGELADKLAVTAANAYGSVSDFGEGILKAGGQAKLANMSLTDTMTALGILGDNGIAAAEGGTALRNVLKNLYTPTTQAQRALNELGVETANQATGALRNTQDVLKDLGKALDGLTEEQRIQAMGEIFDTRTIAAANALIANAGDRWDELAGAIDEAAGAADRMAETQLNNLNGQLTILKSSLEALLISFGEQMLPFVKQAVSWVQKLSDKFNALTDSQKQTVLKFALIAAAIGPVLLVTGRLVALIGSAAKGFTMLGSSITTAGALGAGAIVGLIAVFAKLYATNEKFRNSVNKSFKKLKESVVSFTEKLKPAFEKLLNSVDGLIDKIAEPLANLFDSFVEGFGKIADAVRPIVEKIIDNFSSLIDGISPIFGEIIQTISDLFGSIDLSDLISSIGEIINWISTLISGQLPLVAQVFADAFGAAVQIVQPVIDVVANLAGAIADLLHGDLEGVKQHFEDAFNAAGEAVRAAIDTIKTVFSGLWAGIQPLVQPIIDWFASAASAVGEFFASIPGVISGFLDSAIQFISGFAADVGDFFTSTIPAAIEAAIAWFDELPFKIGYALGIALSSVISFGVNLYNSLVQWVSTTVASVGEFFASLPGVISQWLEEAISAVSDWASNLYETMSSAISNAIDAIVEYLSGLPAKFSEGFDDVITTLSSIDLAGVGSAIMDSLWSGLQSVWGSIKSWFDGLSLNWGKFKAGLGIGFGGSFATGLDYVPRTMNVTVHRGERILTQKENEEYNKGGSVEVVTYQNDEAINKLDDTMSKILAEVAELKNMPIMLDGKKVVGGLVNEIDRQLGLKVQLSRG